MRIHGIVCVFRGHEWMQPPDVHEAYPLFECRRCGRRQTFAQGDRSAGYRTRLEARTGADKIYPGRR